MKRLVIVGLCLALCAAWGCASGAKVDRGQGKMAVTWARQQEKETAETAWDSQNGVYMSERVFHCDAEVDVAIGDAGATGDYTATWDLTHTDSTTVTMVDVARRGKRLKESLSEITVTYEGHWLGVLPIEYKTSTKQKKLLYSYEYTNAAGVLITPKAVGPNGEGINVYVPSPTVTIRKNIDSGAERNKWFFDFVYLVGYTNEPSYSISLITGEYPADCWLLLGYDIIENRDGTYTVQVQLAYDFDNSQFKYRFYYMQSEDQVVNGITLKKGVPVGDEQKEKIYPRAGHDISLKFADMEL